MTKRTVQTAHERIDQMDKTLVTHLTECSAETKAQNSRLKRLETILIMASGATILMLIGLLVRGT